ncbi:hypothetical protein LINGRAHAP2_LOCUS29033, partial [Linum grandiflorum]
QDWRHWKACEIPYNSREGIESKFRRYHPKTSRDQPHGRVEFSHGVWFFGKRHSLVFWA